MATTKEARPERMRRVYTGITISREDLARLHGAFKECGWRTVMHANTFQLHEFEELDAVMDEDHLIEHISMSSEHPRSGGNGRLHLTFDLGYVQLEADDPAWSAGFQRISELLDGIPKNGTTRCSVSLRRRAIRPTLAPSQPSAALEPRTRETAAAAAPIPGPGAGAAASALAGHAPATATLTPTSGAQTIPTSQPSTEQLRGGRLPKVLSGASVPGHQHPRTTPGSTPTLLAGSQMTATAAGGASTTVAAAAGIKPALWIWLAIDAALLVVAGAGMLGLFAVRTPVIGIPLLAIGLVAVIGTILAAGARRSRPARDV